MHTHTHTHTRAHTHTHTHTHTHSQAHTHMHPHARHQTTHVYDMSIAFWVCQIWRPHVNELRHPELLVCQIWHPFLNESRQCDESLGGKKPENLIWQMKSHSLSEALFVFLKKFLNNWNFYIRYMNEWFEHRTYEWVIVTSHIWMNHRNITHMNESL